MVLSLPGRLVLASHVLPKIFDNMGHLSYCITFEFASQVVFSSHVLTFEFARSQDKEAITA